MCQGQVQGLQGQEPGSLHRLCDFAGKGQKSRMGGAKSQLRPFPYFLGLRSCFPGGVGGERRNWGWRRAGGQVLKN